MMGNRLLSLGKILGGTEGKLLGELWGFLGEGVYIFSLPFGMVTAATVMT
jgi:hypothetical protein